MNYLLVILMTIGTLTTFIGCGDDGGNNNKRINRFSTCDQRDYRDRERCEDDRLRDEEDYCRDRFDIGTRAYDQCMDDAHDRYGTRRGTYEDCDRLRDPYERDLCYQDLLLNDNYLDDYYDPYLDYGYGGGGYTPGYYPIY